ncbi:MAG: choice-of-anchor Q domain-containing protein [Actinocrinis sp.]
MKFRHGAMPLALAVAGAGLAAGPAHALTQTVLYVSNGFQSNCSDSGTGTSWVPYCTIGKAVSVVQPGQTVMVAGGQYPEIVTVKAKGTAAAPIRIVGQSSFTAEGAPYATWIGPVGGGVSAFGDHAFVLDGAQYVTVTGFAVTSNKQSVVVQNSQHVTVDGIQSVDANGEYRDVAVDGTSSAVTVSRSLLAYGIELDSGTSGDILNQNIVDAGPFQLDAPGQLPAISATDAPGTVIENNTVPSSCDAGIDLEGTSTGSTIADNIVDTASQIPGSNCAGNQTAPVPVTVAATAATGTTLDYNVAHTPDTSPYSWGGATYADPAALFAATGQGAHDLIGDPKLTVPPIPFTVLSIPCYPSEGSPEIDSGDAALAPSTDVAGAPRVDDPLVADTASDGSHVDRGAYEFQDPIAFVPATVKQAPGGGPLDVDITTGVTGAWSNSITYTYWFEDGSHPTVETSGATDTVAHSFPLAGRDYFSITANDGHAKNTDWDQNADVTVDLGAHYTSMPPTRMLDTRTATGVPTKTPVPAHSSVTLNLAGVDGIPRAGLSAVVMNVTAVGATSGGYLTVYPDNPGDPGNFTPSVSNVNFKAGQTVPNLVTAMVDDGKVRIFNGSAGTVHIVADVEGYYANSGYGFKPEAPVRVLDTRTATGVPAKAPVPANGVVHLDLSSKIPAGAKAVTMNVTVTDARSGGYVTAYPDGSTAPTASNLNFTAGQTVPNLVTVPVHDGKVDLRNASPGTIDLVADLAGYYGDSTTAATAGFEPFYPTRVYDTRANGTGPLAAGSARLVDANTIDNYYPTSGPQPIGAVVNVTVTGPKSNGYLTAYPAGSTRPTASNLNFTAGQTVPNLVSVGIAAGGVDFYNGSGGTVSLVVDVQGLFLPPLS